MKIKSLSINNFLVIGTAEINLDNRGLVLVQGQNDDDSSANSNGAGKSSIVDAISWCLYGETARGVSGDAVVNDSVGKDCSVKIVIEDAGMSYIVMRGRKDKVLKNGLSVFSAAIGTMPPISLTKGTDKLTQEVVNKIVGASYEVFIAAVYSGQEKMPDLPGMTDKMLKLIVEEAAGIERLEAAYNIALMKSKVVQSKVDDVSFRIRTNAELLDTNESEMTGLAKKDAEWHAENVVKIEDLGVDMSAKKSRLLEMPEPNDALCLGLWGTEVKLIEKKIADSQGKEKAELELLSADIEVIQSQLSKSEEKAKLVMEMAKEAKSELEHVADRVGTPCGECGKEYHEEDIRGARVNAQAKLKMKLIELKRCKNVEDIVKSKLNIALEARKKFIDSMTDVSSLLKRHSDIKNLLAESDRRAQAIKQLTAEISALELRLTELKARKSPYMEMIDKRMTDRKSLLNQKESLTNDLLALEGELETTKAAVDVFGRAGVRAHILDTVTPFLNERTAEYLGTLTDGNITASWSTLGKTAKGDIREKFGIAVEKRNGSKSFAGLSGGEKRKVRLSTAMALQDLVASRASKPIEFLLLDEIDDALDVSGLERLMTIIEMKAKSKGTILVVSHNDLASYITETMTIKNTGGISTMLEA